MKICTGFGRFWSRLCSRKRTGTAQEKKVAVFAYLNNNLGDDLFVKLLCERYPKVQFYAEETGLENASLRQLSNLHLSTEFQEHSANMHKVELPEETREYFGQFDALVYIGGSIFMQYGDRWKWGMRIAENRLACARKFFVIGANFGPYLTEDYLEAYRDYFSRIDDICFRDAYSATLFPRMQNVRCAPDVVFTCRHLSVEPAHQVFISVIDCGRRGRPEQRFQYLSHCKEGYEESVFEICRRFHEKGYSICLSAFCVGQNDELVAREILERRRNEGMQNVKLCSYTGNISEVLDEIWRSRYVVATRFHAMILGWLARKPTYPIIYDLKQETVLREVGLLEDSCDIAEVDAQTVVDTLLRGKVFQCESYVRKAKGQFAALDRYLKE